MSQGINVEYVIDKAIEKEIEAQNMYRELGEASTEAVAKDMFRQLTAVEKKHEDLLRRYLAGDLGEQGLKKDAALDYRIAEHFYVPEVTPGMPLADVLLLAANRERASHDLYTALAAAQPEGKVRQLFEDLATQELDHKHRMEDYYTDVAFPQTSDTDESFFKLCTRLMAADAQRAGVLLHIATHDLALIAQSATLMARVPFIHFFDGFRTSHEINKTTLLSDADLRTMIDDELVLAHRMRNPVPHGLLAAIDDDLPPAAQPQLGAVVAGVERKVHPLLGHAGEPVGHGKGPRFVHPQAVGRT